MLSAAWLFQWFSYWHYCLLSSLPQLSYWGIGTILPTPWDLQSRHLVLLRMREGDSRGISRIYVLYKPAHPYPCISSPSLIFFQSIIILIQTRSYYAEVAQTQKNKDGPYLIDFMVEDLHCQALIKHTCRKECKSLSLRWVLEKHHTRHGMACQASKELQII